MNDPRMQFALDDEKGLFPGYVKIPQNIPPNIPVGAPSQKPTLALDDNSQGIIPGYMRIPQNIPGNSSAGNHMQLASAQDAQPDMEGQHLLMYHMNKALSTDEGKEVLSYMKENFPELHDVLQKHSSAHEMAMSKIKAGTKDA